MNRPSHSRGPAGDAMAAAAVAAAGGALLVAGRLLLEDSRAAVPDPGRVFTAGEPLSLHSLELLAGVCAAGAGLVLTVWWVAGFLCAAAGGILVRCGFIASGRRVLAVAPGPMRRLAAALLGLSLAAGAVPLDAALPAPASAAALSAPASSAAHSSAGPASASQDGSEEAVSPLWRPTPPQPPAGNALAPLPRGTPTENQVVVVSGDTLWSLAARQLGPLATDAEIAVLWPKWHALNLHVVGPDPHRILPGQILTVPRP